MCRARILKAAIVTVFLIYLLQIFSPLRLVGDGIDYLLQASSAADGLGFSVHGHTSMRPAGYPFLIVGLIKAGIGKPWAIVALNCLCLAVGCVAIYFISRNTFALTSEGSYIVCLLTMLSFVVVRQAAQPLSDICFFGLSAACLLLILRSEDHPARKWPLLSLAGALVAVCIAVRTIGIALVPPFIWVSLGGRETVKRVSAWVGKNRALSFGAASVLLLGAILVVPDFQHSRYFQFNEPILMHRGIAGSVRAKLNDHSREWGEIMLNLSATKLPGVLTILIQALGLVGLVVFSCSLWRERTQFAVFFLYLLCFSCVVPIYPWYDSRLWLPVIPYIFIYLFIGLKNRVGVNTLRTLVPAWCVVYGCLGMAALAYSTRLTFLAPEEFANSYGDHNLQSAYRVVFGLPTQGDVATNKDAVYLLRRYGVGR